MDKKKAEKLLPHQATRQEAVEVLKRAAEILEKMNVELQKKGQTKSVDTRLRK